MDSSKIDRLKEYLAKRHANYIESIRAHHSSDLVWITVRESAIAGHSSTTQTSRRQLSYLAKAIKQELGINTEFLITRDDDQQNIEAGLNSLIKLQMPGVVRDCLLSLSDDGSMNVWLEPAGERSATIMSALEAMIRDYFRIFKIQLGGVNWIQSDDTEPSLIEIVRMVKVIAPATITQIEDGLRKSGYHIFSTSWIQNKLDLARKRKLLIRTDENRYALTEEGLTIIPHGTTSTSSDIDRALALGKRKW